MIVCDASAASNITLGTPVGRAIRQNADLSGLINAPDIYAYEICNSMWKYIRGGMLPIDTAIANATKALDFIDVSHPCLELYEEAISLAAELNHPVYDVFYLVLARRISATLITCDKRMARLAREQGIDTLYGYDLLAS